MAKHSNFADESYIEELKTQREMEKKERQARRHAARRKYLEAVQVCVCVYVCYMPCARVRKSIFRAILQ